MLSYVIIPAYQPDNGLIKLAADVLSCGNRVIVIDDGSGAEYENVFSGLSSDIVLLCHEVNKGKGAAIKTGMRYILQNERDEFDTVGVMDSDGQHLPADMEKVLAAAKSARASPVLGVREVGGKMPLRSRLGNGITKLVFRLASGKRVSDTQTGLRAFDVEMCEKLLQIEGSRYEYETNVLLTCAKCDVPFTEVPIATVYHDSTNSCSHFRTVVDSFRIYKCILKFSGSSFLSFCVDYILFSLLTVLLGGFMWGTTAANVGARIFSAGFNYTMNCRFVFGEKASVRSAMQYAGLALVILLLNSLMLNFYISVLGMNTYAAKIITEITLFVVSFAVQRLWIFGKSRLTHSKKQ